jgi:phosphoserine phosphatase
LSQIEGIEELGRERRAEVEALTEAAMNGELPLEQVYGRRLELARPSRARVEEVGRMYIDRIVPDTRETVAALLAEGIDVRIISSGVLPAVLMIAEYLGIPDANVAAVDLRFTPAGDYDGFDTESFLAAAHGKLRVVESWRPELKGPVMLVGDGATDLEAKPVVDLFVAFAGVAARPRVIAGADAVIRQNSMAPVLALALDQEPQREPARALYQRGAELMRAAANT